MGASNWCPEGKGICDSENFVVDKIGSGKNGI